MVPDRTALSGSRHPVPATGLAGRPGVPASAGAHRPTADARTQARCFVDEIRLLRRREMARLFPEATLIAQRWYGLNKPWIAVRR